MKKITFILLAFISGTAFAQSASADGQVSAQIVSPITIEAGATLDFGSITPNQGIVVVKPEGYDAAATTATVLSKSTPTAGSFKVNAAQGYAYTVSLPTLVILNASGGATLTLKDLEDNSDGIGNGADETFNIGGTLYIADGQTTGTYTGTVTVGVAYN